jgi:hypothetical protein
MNEVLVMTERTFVDPLYDSHRLIRDVESDIDDIACACRTLGMSALADRLSNLLVDLGNARKLLDEGRDMALGSYVRGSEQATANMVNAAVAVASRVD